MKQADIEYHARHLHGEVGLRMISGKWFRAGEEIKKIDSYIAAYAGTLDRNAIDKIIDALLILQDDTGGLWPEISFPEEFGELPFPLDKKQLVIINRLLYHRMDGDRNLFVTTGIGGSGKSTYLNIVRQLHGNDCANASLTDLSNDFTFAEAIPHRLICSDELASGDLDLPKLKIIASHEKTIVNPKFKTPYELQTQSNCFWCCNSVPRLDITDSGMLRRIVFYERNTKIENPDTSLSHRIYTPKELAIIATKARAYDYRDWFERFFEAETHLYLMKSNSVFICWADDYGTYRDLCSRKGYKSFAEQKWTEIRALFESWMNQPAYIERGGKNVSDVLPF